MALRVVVPGFGPSTTGWRRADPLPEARITEARQKVLDALDAKEPRSTGELARAAGVGAGVVRGMADAGLLVPAVLPVVPAVRHPGPGASRRSPVAGPGRRGRFPAPGGGGAKILGHAAGRRDRLGQDRGVSGGGRGMPAPGPPVARAAAGDRAVLAMAGALRAPLRRRTRGLALGPHLAGPPDHLARGGRGRGAGRGGRPFRAVPAVPRSRPGRGRRGARDGVQAGGGRGLPRPRHGRGARPLLRRPGRAGVGHPQPGDAGERRGRPLSPPDPADAPWRGRVARGDGDRHARCPAGARPFPGAAADPGGPRHAGSAASRRCCSSTAAAMRR